MRRRTFLGGMAALPASLALAQGAGEIPLRAAARVIVDNDFSGDPDGLIALAHQLLSPRARTVLVTTSAIDRKLAGLAGVDAAASPHQAAQRAQELIALLGLTSAPAVVAGAQPGPDQHNAAARAIVAEALRDDPLPLVLTCGGPLTNVAAALRLHPGIARRMRLIWIGGAGEAEYNFATDAAAARYVLAQAALPVWQVVEHEYKRFQISIAELTASWQDISPVSRWLYGQYLQLPPFVQFGGSLCLGDSAMVSLTAFDPELTPYTTRGKLRRYHDFDVRLNLSDLTALLRSHKA